MSRRLDGAEVDTSAAYTLILELHEVAGVPVTLVVRLDGDFVLAHLERTGPASVGALLDAAQQLGHARAELADTDVAEVVVMSAGCSALEVWGVPNIEALAWWADAAGFRPVSRERYFSAFPRVDDGRDRNEEWKATVENLRRAGRED